MNKFSSGIMLLACVLVLGSARASHAQGILGSGDEIIAIDLDFSMQSNYPGGEPPTNALDQDVNTKYLNFGKETSGFIVTPLFGTTTVRSMFFTTADDEFPRDPGTWVLHGTNDTITSTDNSFGTDENWTLIASGDASLPDTRGVDGPALSFTNETSYTSYRLLFPTLKNTVGANSMQVADVRMFESMDATGASVVDFFDTALAVDLGSQSSYPATEAPQAILDGDANTKYLNFGKENSGFIVTPQSGASVVKAFQITTANDADIRDPASWELYGTNGPVTSINNSPGDDDTWTLIDSGTVDLPLERLTAADPVLVNNSTEYTSYRMVFPTIRNSAPSDAMQFADIQFFSVTGDFNGDGNWDCLDIDDLVAEIVAGTNDESFDLTSDGVVDQLDLAAWLVVGGAVNSDDTGGNPYLVGDANLDGFVDGQDFIIWNGSKFTSVAAWCSGDFNADGFVDGQDFIAWNANKFMSSADHAAVPEAIGCWWLLGMLFMIRRGRRHVPG